MLFLNLLKYVLLVLLRPLLFYLCQRGLEVNLRSGKYMVFGVQSCRNGNWMTSKIYCHFDKEPYCFNGKTLAGHFNIDDYSLAILYWAEVPDPEEFKKDFPF